MTALDSGEQAATLDVLRQESPPSHWLVSVGKLAITVTAIGFVLWVVDFQAVVEKATQQDRTDIAIAALVMAMQVVLGAVRWHLIGRRLGAWFPFLMTFQLYYIGSFFSSYVWSGVSGDIVRSWLSYRNGAAPGVAINSVILDRVALIVGIAVLMIVTAPWFFYRFGFGLQAWVPSLVALGLLTMTAVAAQLHHMPARWQTWLPLRMLSALGTAMREIFMRPGAAVPAVAAAMAAQIALGVATYAMARSLGTDITLIDCIVLMQIVALLTAVPISIGGWGVREVSMVALLGLVGVSSSAALLLSIQLGLLGLAVNLPGGLFWILLRPRAHNAKERAEAYGTSAPH